MKKGSLILAFFLCVCVSLQSARADEYDNIVRTVERDLGTNPTGWDRVWCMLYSNRVLKANGFQDTGSLAAKSVSDRFPKVSNPRPGYLALVTRRGLRHHVAFFLGWAKGGNPILGGGNQGARHADGQRKVSKNTYPAEQVAFYKPILKRSAAKL